MTTTSAVQKPYTVHIHDYSAIALAQAAVHIRNGYVFDPSADPEFFPANGQIRISLVLGTPEQDAISAAAATTAQALEQQEAERERDIQAAARQMLEDADRAAKKAELDAQIAAQTKALRKLKDQADKL